MSMQEKLSPDNRVIELNMEEEAQSETRPDKKKIIIAIIGILILIILGGGLFLNRDKLFRTKEGAGTTEAGRQSRRVQDEDMDNDGILDAEEAQMGLSSQDFDTDGDGIPDKMEIDRFKTDPTRADTDGDGFADGYEIINGFNPLGEGKLLN
mgnify:CR=1 FL=1